MNTTPRPDRDLHDLLHCWEVDLPDDAGLAGRVWARLEAQNTHRLPSWLENLSRLLARPVAVAAAIVLFAGAGAAIGELHNAGTRDARVARLAAEYARSIDPILMTDPGAEHSGHTP